MCKESLIDFDCYIVSKCGTIFSKYWKKEIDLKNLSNSGYVKVTLKTVKGKKYKTFSLHRVIWYYFNGDIPDGIEVCHNDSDPQNNSLDNLYLGTHKDNMNNPTTRKKTSDRQKGEKAYWFGKVGPMKGKHHSEETKKKISNTKKGLYLEL